MPFHIAPAVVPALSGDDSIDPYLTVGCLSLLTPLPTTVKSHIDQLISLRITSVLSHLSFTAILGASLTHCNYGLRNQFRRKWRRDHPRYRC